MIGIADFLLRGLLLVPALLIAIPVHEMGHAIAAYLLGDRSVRYFGYLKPDPRRFLEPVGVVAVFFALVGWGKRVPIQPNRVNTTGQRILYELAGPAANLAVAIVLGRILVAVAGVRLSLVTFFTFGPALLFDAAFAIAFLNLSLFAFNLLPIPGLDGWGVLEALFRGRNPRFFFEVSMRRTQVWIGCAIAVFVFQALGFSILSIVMTPFYEPASLISMNTCVGYRIPNLAYLSPCLR